MIEHLFEITQITREMREKAWEGGCAYLKGKPDVVETIKVHLEKDLARLQRSWPKRLKCEHLDNLERHIHFSEATDFEDMLRRDIPGIEQEIERHFRRKFSEASGDTLEGMLHPVVRSSCYKQFKDGLLRDAVFNSITAVFDFIRKRSGSKKDGWDLVSEVFSESNPKLIFSELTTLSGKMDQRGFLKIFGGAYEGIRNPKAHTLDHDLTTLKTAQYLVFMSLLARRIEEAKTPTS